MSIFSKIGKGLKAGLGFVGDVGKKVAPVVGLVPGIGTLAAAGIGAGSSLASDAGHGRSISLGNALKSGAMGAAGGLAGGALKGIGAGSKLAPLKNLAGGLVSKIAGGKSAPVDTSSEFGASSWNGGQSGGKFAGIKSLLSGIDPLTAATVGLGAVNAVQSAKARGQQGQLRNRAIAQLDEPQMENLDSLFSGGNPYAASAGPNKAKLAAIKSLGY